MWTLYSPQSPWYSWQHTALQLVSHCLSPPNEQLKQLWNHTAACLWYWLWCQLWRSLGIDLGFSTCSGSGSDTGFGSYIGSGCSCGLGSCSGLGWIWYQLWSCFWYWFQLCLWHCFPLGFFSLSLAVFGANQLCSCSGSALALHCLNWLGHQIWTLFHLDLD